MPYDDKNIFLNEINKSYLITQFQFLLYTNINTIFPIKAV